MQHSKLIHTCIALLVSTACGPASDELIAFKDHQTATHELTQRMTLSETNDLLFGRLSALLIASDGVVLVADQQLYTIHQFDADGAYIGSIGQEGRGPGEFEAIGNMSFGLNDSLYVWDWSATRLSIFARNEATWTFTRSFIMKHDNDGYFLSTLSRRPWIDGYLILESVPFFAGMEHPEIKQPRFREITVTGEELRVITSYPPSQNVVRRRTRHVLQPQILRHPTQSARRGIPCSCPPGHPTRRRSISP
jgi:hypothetical protein